MMQNQKIIIGFNSYNLSNIEGELFNKLIETLILNKQHISDWTNLSNIIDLFITEQINYYDPLLVVNFVNQHAVDIHHAIYSVYSKVNHSTIFYGFKKGVTITQLYFTELM